ncbi:hypothetical protein CWC46_21640 [Prodigiosinella confusarubida]|uniref:Uncharacterized protein n=1 Tax=Serratia sp. (strain ATCC 39006) TaxID=104623 RepID=A0A2I5TC89_SERS3|nr:hypothetical protein [Serratia sp. ATCC 39006]AUH02163.1 hypothetical protein CWC46_21640 [Serratia sp. ATCC 39006]AUH06484.1 hypothetical protein Ser39006_021630 [Serratia sp. ATCC 39006]
MNVLFIGDVNRGAQDVNIERLFRLFSPVFKEVNVTASMYISEVNKKVSISDWLEVWRESIDKNRVSEIANLDLSNTAIIGFEISDADINYFSENKIPWVNFSIHPIRFLDDLYFDVTTSFDYDLSNHAASTGLIDFCVNKIKSSINSTSIKKEKTLAIFGQTPIDKSIYFDGEFKKLTSYLDKIDALARDYPRVIYRPHPNLTDESVDKIIIERYGAEIVPEKNFYKFLITESIDKCCAISSSVNTESPYFGVESVNLDDRARKYGVAVNYKSLLDDREFWVNKFLNMDLFSSPFNISVAVPDNYLRDVYESWGYITKEQEIYTIINTKEQEIYTVIKTIQDEISNLEERNNHYLIELERSEQHVNALLNSRSWIVTSPLRFIKRCFMELFLFIYSKMNK